MAQALQQHGHSAAQQLGLYGPDSAVGAKRGTATSRRPSRKLVLCAACRASEARYGFRAEGEDAAPDDRPRTLCFECFRVEVLRRQAEAARTARGWNGGQVRLPLEERLRTLSRRRHRAQIEARHALGL